MDRVKGFSIESYLKNLEYLVNTESGSTDVEGIMKVAEFLSKKFEEIGMNVKVHNLEEVGPCLEIRNYPEDENIDIMLMGHMDTVFPKGTIEEWTYSSDSNKAYGPGVIDMKSGLLNIYEMMRLMDRELRDRIKFCILMNPDEEISSRKSKEVIIRLAQNAKYAFVMEPARANGDLVKERKGLAKYLIEFIGKAAHSGVDPENGRSAIMAAARFMIEMEKQVDRDKGINLNFGTIKGGTVANVVAEHAKTELDLRYVQGEQIDIIEKELHRLAEVEKDNDIHISITRMGYRPPMNPSEKSLALIELYNKVAAELGHELNWVATGGGSDGNFTAFEGVATIDALGPIGGGAHSRREYLDINSVEPRIQMLLNLIIAMKEKNLI